MTHAAARRRTVAIALALLLMAVAAPAATLLPPDPDLVIGRAIPFDGFVDEQGRPVPKPADDPRPWLISPIYTQCQSTCSAITAGLAAALRRAELDAGSYRVISLSFDPHETDASLAEFRTRMQLPPDWATVRATDRAALQRTLRSLDFRTIELDGGHFEHPNLVTVLDAERRAVAMVYGIAPSPDELGAALARARDGAAASDGWRPYLFFFAAVGYFVSSTVVAILLHRAHRRRLATGAPQAGSRPAPRSAR
ncbi:MAG: SCO family protein [Candidatus Binatia bacterium]